MKTFNEWFLDYIPEYDNGSVNNFGDIAKVAWDAGREQMLLENEELKHEISVYRECLTTVFETLKK